MRSDAMALVHRGVLDVQPVDVRLRQAIAQIPLELVEPWDPVRVRQRTHLEPQLVALFGRHGQILASAGDGGNRVRTAYHEVRSEEHTSELQSLMRISYAVFCLKKKTKNNT